MLRKLLSIFLTLYSTVTFCQLNYTLIYSDSSIKSVKIIIQPSAPLRQSTLIMPRSVPGTYEVSLYDRYLQNIYAFTSTGEKLPMTQNQNGAPRWNYADTSKKIVRLEYDVNLDKMEKAETAGSSSIIRSGFAGLLNYSIFGWIEGTETQTVQCTIKTFDSWPIFTTLQPSSSPKKGELIFTADNYYALADAQTFMGPRFQVKQYKAMVPLFVVSYSQTTDEYLDDYAEQEKISMGVLKEYFGELPFPFYSLMLRKAIPPDATNAPVLAMEHLQSSTFFGDTTGLRLAPMPKERILQTIPTYLHHMSHALFPLRCYGDTYRPYVQEIPPIINNIWFNEGFMWFLPCDTLRSERMKARFKDNVYKTSPIIKKMSLQQLSQAASTMYSSDFRIGLSIYSRGALMALEMNDFIIKNTNGSKSMKDVFRYLYQWSKENRRAFTMEEFPKLINAASGVDLSVIYNRWQLPIE